MDETAGRSGDVGVPANTGGGPVGDLSDPGTERAA